MIDLKIIPRKSLKELAWNVEESEYRASPNLSYSKIAKYAREGHRTLFDDEKLSTASLTFCSLVDCLLTDPPEAFNEKFVVLDYTMPSEAIATIIEALFESLPVEDRTPNIYKIPREAILTMCDTFGYSITWKADTRIDKILSTGADYFKALYDKSGKIAITEADYADALKCKEEVLSNPFTAKWMNNDPNSDIEDLYQTKFIIDAPYKVRCMFDKIVVDHTSKIIYPIDLKTTFHHEEDFITSFYTWRYDIQANLYSYILETICKQDEYFAQFTIAPWRFVVVSRATKSPLVWVFNQTNAIMNPEIKGILMKDDRYEIKPWHILYEEMQYYYSTRDIKYSRKTIELQGEIPIDNLQIKILE